MWQWIKSLFSPEKEKESEWLPLWHSHGIWVDSDGNHLHNCYYTIRYYPDEHKVTLHSIGHNFEEHQVYATALQAFNQCKRWMIKYDREFVLNYIKTIDNKKTEVSGSKKKKLSEMTLEELRDMMDKKLKAEKYEDVREIQDIIDKKTMT